MLEITIDNCYKYDLETINDPNNSQYLFILMSEKSFIQHDVENKQLKVENKKLNENGNDNDNENKN